MLDPKLEKEEKNTPNGDQDNVSPISKPKAEQTAEEKAELGKMNRDQLAPKDVVQGW